MGQKQVVYVQPLPEKTLKQKVKQFSRQINKLKRQFQRELYKFQANERKMQGDLQRMVKTNQPMSSKRITAQNIIRNQKYMQKYHRLDAQMDGMLFHMATTQTLVNVMGGMAQLMGKTNQAMNVKSMEQAMMMFQTQMQRGAIIGETIEDAMNMGQQDIDDQAADQLIAQMQLGGTGGKGGNGYITQQTSNKNFFESMQGRLDKI